MLTPNAIVSPPASFKVTCQPPIAVPVPLAVVPAQPHTLDVPGPLPVRALPRAPSAAKDVFQRSKLHVMPPPMRR